MQNRNKEQQLLTNTKTNKIINKGYKGNLNLTNKEHVAKAESKHKTK